MDALIAPKPLKIEDNTPELWKQWRERFETFILASGISEKSEKQQCAVLKHVIGADAAAISKTFSFTEEEEDDLEVLLNKYDDYFEPIRNITVERYKFNKRIQHQGESFDAFLTDLRQLVKTCDYGDLTESLIKDRVVIGIFDDCLRERLLRQKDLTLKTAAEMCRSFELSKVQLKEMSSAVNVNVVSNRGNKHEEKWRSSDNRSSRKGYRQRSQSRKRNWKQDNKQQNNFKSKCKNCGGDHERKPQACPAFGRTCYKCHRSNHFGRVCFSKKVMAVQSYENEDGKDDESYEKDCFVISTLQCISDSANNNEEECSSSSEIAISHINTEIDKNAKENRDWYVNIGVGKDKCIVKFKLDTGANINTITEKIFEKMKMDCKVKPMNSVVTNYCGNEIPTKGKVTIPCFFKEKCYWIDFALVQINAVPVLSLSTCLALGLIKRLDEIKEQSVMDQYPSVFEPTVGKLKGVKYRIRVNEEVSPVVNAPRKVPFAIRERVKAELDKMTEQGIITKVTKPTPWVNSMVIVEKQDKTLRICLDPLHLNKAVKREHYQLPTVEDICSKLAGAKYFSVLDAAQGFYQIELEEDSTEFTTFHSPFGRYKFLRLPFGISSAPEVFHRAIAEMLEDLEGCLNYIDDILVWGSTKEEHDRRLREVLKRIKQWGLKLTKRKCKEAVTELKYLGVILTQDGIKPDNGKIEAILRMPEPVDKEGIRRFLGMVNHFSKFLPDLASTTASLRELLNKKVEWHWETQHQESFDNIKKILVSANVLTYFDPDKETLVSVDASKEGLGAVLIQDSRPVAFASRALSETEKRYAQIEKETLAVVFGCERFHDYLYGRKFQVESDHKPLEVIVRKTLDKAPPRIQRFLLKLQKYQFELKHVPGKNIPVADALSRAYLPYCHSSISSEADLQVHFMIQNLPIASEKYGKIVSESERDEVLIRLKNYIMNGWPDNKQQLPELVKSYWNFREEMHCADGLIFKGNCVVIPSSMRKEILSKIHDGHLGIEMCRRRARAVVYWPGLGNQIEEMVKKCSICQRYNNSQQKETLTQYETPDLPWQQVASDLFQWAGKDYLLVVDRYSGYPEIALLSNTTASIVIKHMKSIFARHGIPETLMSDNGTQYTSSLFKKFTEEWGFNHITSSPTYPQSNGLAERTVQTVKRLLKKALDGGEDPYLALLSYRNTATKTYSPAELLMGRSLKTRLPVKSSTLKPVHISTEEAKAALEIHKEKQKCYYDRSAKDLTSLTAGDRIRVREGKVWLPGWVTSKTNYPKSYNIKTETGNSYRRNRRDLLLVPKDSTELPIENVPIEDESIVTAEKSSGSPNNSESVVIGKENSGCMVKPDVTVKSKVRFHDGNNGPITTRSGRVVIKPKRYPNYM